jgi:microcystin-dependent protein
MGEPYVGEIRMFAGNFAPAGWAFAAGQLLPISQNETLFNLIGTTYGGDGQETFALPNIQSRFPIHAGQGPGISQSYQLAETGGVESVTLTTQQMPTHNHAFLASTAIAQNPQPTSSVPAQSSVVKLYTGDDVDSSLGATMFSPVGGSQPHDNLQPYLAINYILSLFGVFPHQ